MSFRAHTDSYSSANLLVHIIHFQVKKKKNNTWKHSTSCDFLILPKRKSTYYEIYTQFVGLGGNSAFSFGTSKVDEQMHIWFYINVTLIPCWCNHFRENSAFSSARLVFLWNYHKQGRQCSGSRTEFSVRKIGICLDPTSWLCHLLRLWSWASCWILTHISLNPDRRFSEKLWNSYT